MKIIPPIYNLGNSDSSILWNLHMAAQIGSNDVYHRFARGAAQRKRTDCSRSARSNTKAAARTATEQRIENASFTEFFNVSMAFIS
jgi:hypothetical protein